jgi:hypothetical protein
VLTFKNIFAVALVLLAIAFTGNAAKADGIPLGVIIFDTPNGIEVTAVIPGGIADHCMPRLRPGAHIVTLNGLPVKSAEDFKRVIDSSNFVRFEFTDPKGEFRWARAWSSGHAPSDAKPCYILGVNPQNSYFLNFAISPCNCLTPAMAFPCFIR